MVRLALLIFSMLLVAQLTIAQSFEVEDSKKCYYLNGKKVKKGDVLNEKSEFLIEETGQLLIRYPNRWPSAYTVPKRYKMDTLVNRTVIKKEYIIHDSIYRILSVKNTLPCMTHVDVYSHSYSIRFRPLGSLPNPKPPYDRIFEIAEPSVKIKWTDRIEYKGMYYVVVSNMFDENIDLKMVDERFVELDLTLYKEQYAIMYKVLTQDCRESDYNVIKMK